MKYYNDVVEEILKGAIKATKYVSPKEIVRAVRTTYKIHNRKPRKGENIQITLTIGRPNYVEREFIKLCKEAKEPFPVRYIQLKFYKPKAKLKGRIEKN